MTRCVAVLVLLGCGPSVADPVQSGGEEATNAGDPGEDESTTTPDDTALPQPVCGNGVVDIGEECDGAALVAPRPCAGDGTVPPLPAPLPGMPYAGGTAMECNDDCRLSRVACTYCGDGVRQDAVPLDDAGLASLPEWCDGDTFDEQRLAERFGDRCPDEEERPAVTCAEDCASFGQPDPSLSCCVQPGGGCPAPGSGTCCYALEHPDESPCVEEFTDEGIIEVLCK